MPKEDRDARDAALKSLKRTLGGTEYAQFKALIKDLKEISKTERPDPRLLRSSELELRTLFRRAEAFAILRESYKHFIPRELAALRDVIKAARGSLAPLPPAATLPAPTHLTSSAGWARDGPGMIPPAVNGLLQGLAQAGMLPPASCSHLSASASMPVVHDLAPTPGLGGVWPGGPDEQRVPLTAQQERARVDAATAAAAGWTATAAALAAPPTERDIFEEQERSGFATRFEPPPPAAPPPMSAALASILSRPALPKPAAPRPAAKGAAGAAGAAAGGKRVAAAGAVPKAAAAAAAVLAPPPPSAKPATPAANTSGDPSRRHGGYAPVSVGARLVENRVNAITAVMQQAITEPDSSQPVEPLLSMLRELGSIRMTRDLLRSTGVGKAINELRSKHADEALIGSASELLSRWREVIKNPPPPEPAPPPAAPTPPPAAASVAAAPVDPLGLGRDMSLEAKRRRLDASLAVAPVKRAAPSGGGRKRKEAAVAEGGRQRKTEGARKAAEAEAEDEDEDSSEDDELAEASAGASSDSSDEGGEGHPARVCASPNSRGEGDSPRCSRRCVWRRARRSTCRKTTPPVWPRWRYAARRRRWPRPSWPCSASSRRALKRAHSHPMPGAIPLYSMICNTVIREETAAKRCVSRCRER